MRSRLTAATIHAGARRGQLPPGLSLCQRVRRAHNGELDAASTRMPKCGVLWNRKDANADVLARAC